MFTVVAIVIIAAVLIWHFYYKNLQTINNIVETEGEVMDFEEISQPDLKSIFAFKKNIAVQKAYPIVKFRVQGAKMVKFRAQKGFKFPLPYTKGDKIKVEYEANNPLIARIK